MKKRTLQGCWLALLLSGCGVQAKGSDSGGVTDSPTLGCPAGVTVLMSDYVSTQVALSDLRGVTLSSSLVSTASSETNGLAFALSGDVALPSAAPRPGTAVLIDRFGTNVLTWLDTKTGRVTGQLPVGTGFESNPQDYVEVDAQRAFVSRWGQNGDPGREAFDAGGDVLVIDLEAQEIVNRIEMPILNDLPPRPSGLFRIDGEVIVALDRISLDFATTGTATLVGVSIDDESIRWRLTLRGLKSCGRPARSPSGDRLAVACSGALDPGGNIESIDQSAVVLFDADQSPPQEIARFSAEELAGTPLQADVEFASDEVVLLKTQTPLGAEGSNRWFSLDVDSGTTRSLLSAQPGDDGQGVGLVFGSMACAPGCSNLCLMTDADQGVLQRVRLQDGEPGLIEPVTVERQVGLPPRGVSLRR